MSDALRLPTRLAERETLRVRDLVDAFGLSRAKVHSAIKDGRIDAVHLDGVTLLRRESVERYLATARVAK
jgi:hypothetical protein